MQINLNELCQQIHKITEEPLRENPIDVFGLFITFAAIVAAGSCRNKQDRINTEEFAIKLFKQTFASASQFSAEGESLH